MALELLLLVFSPEHSPSEISHSFLLNSTILNLLSWYSLPDLCYEHNYIFCKSCKATLSKNIIWTFLQYFLRLGSHSLDILYFTKSFGSSRTVEAWLVSIPSSLHHSTCCLPALAFNICLFCSFSDIRVETALCSVPHVPAGHQAVPVGDVLNC